MNLKKNLNLISLASNKKMEVRNVCKKDLNSIKGGNSAACSCGGTDCGTHGARDGLKDLA